MVSELGSRYQKLVQQRLTRSRKKWHLTRWKFLQPRILQRFWIYRVTNVRRTQLLTCHVRTQWIHSTILKEMTKDSKSVSHLIQLFLLAQPLFSSRLIAGEICSLAVQENAINTRLYISTIVCFTLCRRWKLISGLDSVLSVNHIVHKPHSVCIAERKVSYWTWIKCVFASHNFDMARTDRHKFTSCFENCWLRRKKLAMSITKLLILIKP